MAAASASSCGGSGGSGPSLEINYPNFASTAGLQLNGSPIQTNSTLTLADRFNQIGSAFTVAKVNVASFHAVFIWLIGNPEADGMTFCIQGMGPSALGDGGFNLGYGQFNGSGGIGDSVAVSFDIKWNATGLFTDGASPNTDNGPINSSSLSPVSITSGDVMKTTLVYSSGQLVVTTVDQTTQASSQQTYAIDIPSTLGASQAYVGFTAACGGLGADIQILSWTLGK